MTIPQPKCSIIYDSRVYDLGYIWNFGDIATAITTGFKAEVTSTIAKYEDKVNTAISEFVKTVNED